MKIMTVDSNNPYEFRKKVNAQIGHLVDEGLKIIDIKYAAYYQGPSTWESAMIIYDEND